MKKRYEHRCEVTKDAIFLVEHYRKEFPFPANELSDDLEEALNDDCSVYLSNGVNTLLKGTPILKELKHKCWHARYHGMSFDNAKEAVEFLRERGLL
jgi:hypothetical protein